MAVIVTESRAALLRWGGIPLGLMLVALLVAWWWSGQLNATERQLHSQHQRYVEAYLAGSEKRLSVKQALLESQDRLYQQTEQLQAAERQLAPELPLDFRTTHYATASDLQLRILQTIRSRAEREAIVIPEQLPLSDGLSSEEATRANQLVQLFLLQRCLDTVFNHSKRVDELQLLPAQALASAAYVRFGLALRFTSDFRGVHLVLEQISGSGQGLSIRQLDLRRGSNPDLLSCRLEIGLLVAGDQVEVAAPAPGPERRRQRQRRR